MFKFRNYTIQTQKIKEINHSYYWVEGMIG